MGEGERELPLRKGEHSEKIQTPQKKHLYTNILQQMEFYFSDSNPSKDYGYTHQVLMYCP